MGLLELSAPVKFEPVGPVTTVFFDDKNQQVFSVRSGGATGVTIKSPLGSPPISLRTADQGPIISIKLSPCHSVLAVQRAKQQVDFLNVSSPETEYSQGARTKNCVVLGFLWTTNTEVVFITDLAIELYSVTPDKRSVKYLRSSSVAVAWFYSCPKEGFLATAATMETQTLQVWSLRSGGCYKLGSIEADSGTTFREKDVAMLRVYGVSYLAVTLLQEGGQQVRLYQLANDSLCLKYSLQLASSDTAPGPWPLGPIAIQVVDSLVCVHSQGEGRTRLYDLRLGDEEGSPCPIPVQPCLPPTAICQEDSGFSQALPYSPSWVVFRPAVLVDARTGNMWTLRLRLEQAQGGDPLTLVQMLLNREGGKAPLLQFLQQCLCSPTLPLPTLGTILGNVVGALQAHLKQVGPPPSVVVDQPDLFTHIFSPAASREVPLDRLQAGLLELLLCLASAGLPPRQFFHELLISLAVQSGQFFQLHQLLQYGVLGDSKPVACLLLSLEAAYPPARQLALDMMSRLGTASEEMVEIFLAQGKLVPALHLVKSAGLVDSVSARKFLEAADKTGDKLVFFNVFSFFEERNLRMRGSGKFSRGEQCDPYVHKFRGLFVDSATT